MEKIINRGDWDTMINLMDKLKAAAQKSMTAEDQQEVAEKIAGIRAVLETYTPHGLN